jgi:hypothetical protein
MNAAIKEAQARVRADGGPLYVVVADYEASGEVWRSEGFAEIDARRVKLDLDLNAERGTTVLSNARIERVR